MSKLRKITNRKSPFTQSQIDAIAQLYLEITVRLEQVKKKLLADCRKYGFTPKDAPKTKMLAGELYEVLASRATRTDVDQKKVRAFRIRICKSPGGPAAFQNLFENETIYSVCQDWQHTVSCPALRAGFSHDRLLKLFSDCLRLSSSRRLTVRKRKLAKLAKSAKPANRKAA